MGKDQEPQPNHKNLIEEDHSPLISTEGLPIESTVSRKPSRKLLRGYILLNLFLMAGTIGGTVGFIVGTEYTFREVKEIVVRTLGEGEFKVKPAERIEVEDPYQQATLLKWQQIKSSYQQTFYEAVNFNNAKEIIKPLRQLAINHTLYGAELLNKILLPPQFEVDYDSNKLTINDASYDLSKPRDFHLTSAIIDTQISFAYWSREAQSTDQQRQEEARIAVKEAESDLGYLYFVDKYIGNIYFAQESFLYFPRELFVAMAKITQTLDRYGYPQPKTILITKAGTEIVGEYLSHEWPVSPFTVVMRGNIWDGGVIHEWGHFIQDIANYEEISKEKGEKVSLERYQEKMEAITKFYQDRVEDLNNQYLSEYAKKNWGEDYAETFMWYFWYGDNFRGILEELKNSDPASYEILKAKYDFFKNVVFEGEEFANEGEIFNQQTEIEEGIGEEVARNFQVGDLVEIEDENESRPGILLRSQPPRVRQENDDPTKWPAVFDGDEVKIIEGPEFVTINYFEGNQIVTKTVPWWRVEIYWQGEKSSHLLGLVNGKGWISEEWFGEVLLPTR